MFAKLNPRVKLFLPLLAVLALAASCKDEEQTCTNKIVCQNSPQHLGADGTATLTFYCYWDWEANPKSEYQNGPCKEIPVTFTAVGGTCTSNGQADRNGIVTCVFTASNPATFEGGTVTAVMESYWRDGTGRVETALNTTTAVGQILPAERPSKEKAKPKIKIIGEEKPVIGDDGKSKLIFELSEKVEGETADRVIPGTEVKFETDKPDQVTITPEKAMTDENGQVSVEVEAKDQAVYDGTEITAKADVKYSDGTVGVETKVQVQSSKKVTYSLTCTNLPQVVNAEQNPITFKISKAVEGMDVTAPVYGASISFTAENGTVTPESATTDGRGEATVQFKYSGNDILSFTGGAVTATATVEGQALTCTAPIDPFEHVEVTCADTPRTIDGDGKASLTFSVIRVNGATREPIANTKVQFTATKGKCDAEGTTDSNGTVKVAFETGEINVEDFDEATITATCTYDGKSYSGEGVVSGMEWTYNVECIDSPQTVSARYLEKVTLWFKLTATSGSITKPLKHRSFEFTATKGKVESSSMSIYTDDDGQMAADFFPDEDIYCFEEATVTATFTSSDGKTASAQGVVKGLDWTYTVECTNSGQVIDKDGKASLDFEVIAETDHPKEGHVKRLPSKALIAFTSNDGSVSPASGLTNDDGRATVVFETKDILNFKEGKVTGAFDGTINGKTVKGSPKVKGDGEVKGMDWTYTLTCTNSGVKADEKGAASLNFELSAKAGELTVSVPKATVSFTAEGGTVSPASATTDDSGKVTANFQATDPDTFEEGKVTGSCSIGGKTVSASGDIAGEPKDGLEKPRRLKDNTFVLIDKNGNKEEGVFDPNHNEWSIKKGEVSVMLYEADEHGSTAGMFYGYCPWAWKNTAISVLQIPNIKMNFERYKNNKYVFAHPGNVKAKSKFMVKPKTPSNNSARRSPARAAEYTGDVQCLFYYEFTNESDGEDYIVYGNGTMHEHVPVITYFRLKEENIFMKVGDKYTIELESYSEEEVTWDWNDVQLIAQAGDYSGWADNKDEGYFSWDAATHTLTALKAYSNVYAIYLKFALKSRPSVTCQHHSICVGEGWPYTSFTISPAEQEITPYSGMQFSIQWEPASEPWDPAAIEIDPDSNKNNNYYYIGSKAYGTYGSLYMWQQGNPVYGTETLTFRLKSNHDIKASMKITLKPSE